MSKKRLTLVALVTGLIGVGLLVGWNANWGRPKPTATVKLVNQSGQRVDYVTFYLDDAKGDKANQYLQELEPGRAISVAIPTSELRVRQITCEHPDFKFVLAYDKSVKIAAGRVFVVALAEDGGMTGEFE